jgi:hypothetical protein
VLKVVKFSAIVIDTVWIIVFLGAGASWGDGESGIRTHGMISHTHAFQACPFDHSGISPTGVPGRNRTDNLLLRRQLLYPIELQVHGKSNFIRK